MPPRAKPTPASPSNSTLFVISSATSIHSIHANKESADEALLTAKQEGGAGFLVTTHDLIGGTIIVAEDATVTATNSKSEIAKKRNKPVEPKTVAAKTKTPAEQRAANAAKGVGKGVPSQDDLPDNVRELLSGSGGVLSGCTVVVTGVPPTIGRKNAEKLVEAYGGKLTKSLSKNTSYVIVGNDAGPKK